MKKFNVTVDGKTYAVEVDEVGGSFAAAPVAAGAATVTAPMNGTIFKVNCAVGDTVGPDDAVIILEAMKMENEIFAGVAGTVTEVRATVGAAVQPGDVLVVIG